MASATTFLSVIEASCEQQVVKFICDNIMRSEILVCGQSNLGSKR